MTFSLWWCVVGLVILVATAVEVDCVAVWVERKKDSPLNLKGLHGRGPGTQVPIL